ncbi:MAG: NAD-dependent epimerase/dehydratase family protein [Pseudomonadota bacterium]
MSGQVLILGGSGRIGRYSTRAFEEAGWKVRQFDRKNENMAEAAKGCDVIINGLNPPNYHDWETLLPQITETVVDAARKSGATVILPGNVYHFGDQGGLWSEQTPPNSVSRKGAVRLRIERDYRDSGVQTIVLRAGNFIDPEARSCIMALIYLRAIKNGKITLPGPAETRQAMCFLGDWARAAVQLAEKRPTLAPFEDIPFPGHTLTGHDIKKAAETALGHKLTFTKFPWWMFTLTAPVWELAREMKEMRYLYETDHALSDKRLKALLPDFEATPIEQIIRDMLAARD